MKNIYAFGFLTFFLVGHLFSQVLSANPPLKKVKARVGAIQILAEVAVTPRELAQGLMFRDRLLDNSGMIFCLQREERASFWMKNVSIPLSVAYLDRKGIILEILEMKPFDERAVWSQSEKVYYALEMNQGWFQLNQVKEGMRLVLEGKELESLRENSLKSKNNEFSHRERKELKN